MKSESRLAFRCWKFKYITSTIKYITEPGLLKVHLKRPRYHSKCGKFAICPVQAQVLVHDSLETSRIFYKNMALTVRHTSRVAAKMNSRAKLTTN